MRLIKKGAEADVYLTSWGDQTSILKIRKRKEYRNEVLDRRIRTLRTIREAKMLSDAKLYGVRTPLVYFVDPKKCEIYMQFVEGKLVRDIPDEMIVKTCEGIGKVVGTLHRNGLTHGDLTTSNFIISHGKLVVLDFGLSQRTERVEDHAIDLRLFKEVLNSAHVAIVGKAWSSFLKGYGRVVGSRRREQVISQLSAVERRGRYASVT